MLTTRFMEANYLCLDCCAMRSDRKTQEGTLVAVGIIKIFPFLYLLLTAVGVTIFLSFHICCLQLLVLQFFILPYLLLTAVEVTIFVIFPYLLLQLSQVTVTYVTVKQTKYTLEVASE